MQQRIKETLDFFLTGGRDSCHGAAMKGISGSNDLIALRTEIVAAVLTGQLDGRFIGLGAAVAEKGLISKRVFTEQLCQFDLLRDLIIVGTVNQLAGLFLKGCHNLGMTMPQIINRHATEKIQIFLAVHIPKPATLSPGWDNRIATIGLHDIFVGLLNPLF